MKKVLFLIHTLGGGGAEKVLVNLANGMDKKIYEVTVMTVINTGIFRADLDSDVKYKYIFNPPFKKSGKAVKEKEKNDKSGSLLNKSSKLLSYAAKLYSIMWRIIPLKTFYKLLIKEEYDVEIAFLEGICAKIISGSSNKNSKKISWIHVDLINQQKSKFVFNGINDEKSCYESFDKIICVSENVKEQFVKKFAFDKSKVLVKYNPINKNEIEIKAQETVDDIIKPDKFVFCTIGRLITQKGYDRLLRVHKRLVDENYNYELWIIGDGTKREQLERFINENNLRSSVKLLGFKSNPYKYLNMSDAFVCSSRAEGFSTVACEAVVLGKPIVTVDCSGMKELLGYDNEYGIVTENNEDALFDGIKKMLNDKQLYDDYKIRIKERVNMFNIENAVKEIEQLC